MIKFIKQKTAAFGRFFIAKILRKKNQEDDNLIVKVIIHDDKQNEVVIPGWDR